MRPLEALILILLTAGTLAVLTGISLPRRVALMALGATLAIVALHAFFEGIRWHLFPALALLLIGWLVTKRRGSDSTRPKASARVKLGRIAFVFAALVAIALPILFPVPSFPEPTGEFAVGISDFAVRFEDRRGDADLGSERQAGTCGADLVPG